MRLLDHTKELFRLRPRTMTLPRVASEAGIDLSWLQQLSKGTLKSVDADKLQTLYEFLTGDRGRLNF